MSSKKRHDANAHAKDGERPVRRELSIPVLVSSLVIVPVLAIALYFWHSFQYERLASAFEQRSELLAKEDKAKESADYLFRYVQMRPDDAEGRVRLAHAYDKSAGPAQRPRTIELFYRAIGVAPDDIESKYRLIELLLESKRFSEAKQQSQELVDQNASDAKSLRLRALAMHGQYTLDARGSVPKLYETLRDAATANPGDPELAMITARFIRNELSNLPENERIIEADGIINRMVSVAPRKAENLLARYQYRLEFNLPEGDDLEVALASAPEDPTVLVAAAERALRRKEKDAAIKFLESAIQVDPENRKAWLTLGDLYFSQGDVQGAIAKWTESREKIGADDPAVNFGLAKAYLAINDLSKAETQIKQIERIGQRLRPMLPQNDAAIFRANLGLLQAQLSIAQRNYPQAIERLKETLAAGSSLKGSVRVSVPASQVHFLLGASYAAMAKWDQSAKSYEDAIAAQPNLYEARVAAGQAWLQANRPKAATEQFRMALAQRESPQLWLAYAQAELLDQLSQPPTSRSWRAFQSAVAKLQRPDFVKELQEPWRVTMLEADYSVLSGTDEGDRAAGITAAVELLKGAESRFAERAEFWRDVAVAYQTLGQLELSDAALEKYLSVGGESTDYHLTYAQLLAQRNEPEKASEVLEKALASASASDLNRIQLAKAQLAGRRGESALAREQLRKLQKAQPANTAVLVQLAEMAVEAGDWGEAQTWEDQLRTLEGADGTFWKYFQVQRLLSQVTGPDHPKLVSADELANQVVRARPTWSGAYLLKGRLALVRNHTAEAIEHLSRAVEYGATQLPVYERLVSLLYQHQRFAEAEQYLARLEKHVSSSPQLSAVAIPLSAQQGQLDRAVELAQQGAADRPNDTVAQIWLGQVLLLAGKTEEAEAAFQKAVDGAPKDARAWSGLFSFYVRTKRDQEARETLEKLAKESDLTEAQRALALAQGHMLLGDEKEVERHFREAAKLAPDDVDIQVRWAAYLLRTDVIEAERVLKRVVYDLKSRSGVARRMLAAIYASRGGDNEWDQAEKLLENTGEETDQRFQALLLSRRGGSRNVEKARRILERLPDPTSGDRLLLAQLYETEGKLQSADGVYLTLCTDSNARPEYFASYIDFLLRHDDPQKAQGWLSRLEQQEPESFRYLGLKARWLNDMEKSSEVEPLIEPLAEKFLAAQESPEGRTAVIHQVGQLYAKARHYKAAERWYGKLETPSSDQMTELAVSIAKQGHVREAVQYCQDALDRNPNPQTSASMAGVLAAVLASGEPTAEDYALAEPMFERALRENPDDVAVLLSLANVRVLQHRHDDAIRLYETILQHEPKNVLALNNAANVLAESSEGRQKALEYINRAIDLAGSHPAFLDTKGTILLHENKLDPAITVLEQAVAASKADPRFSFHLAVALARKGDFHRARLVWKQAQDNELESQILTQSDEQLLSDLKQQLANN